MAESCHFTSQNKNEIEIFSINKPNAMKSKQTTKQTKYQQNFHCFIVCKLVPYQLILF